jgi:hypothetical protein
VKEKMYSEQVEEKEKEIIERVRKAAREYFNEIGDYDLVESAEEILNITLANLGFRLVDKHEIGKSAYENLRLDGMVTIVKGKKEYFVFFLEASEDPDGPLFMVEEKALSEDDIEELNSI